MIMEPGLDTLAHPRWVHRDDAVRIITVRKLNGVDSAIFMKKPHDVVQIPVRCVFDGSYLKIACDADVPGPVLRCTGVRDAPGMPHRFRYGDGLVSVYPGEVPEIEDWTELYRAQSRHLEST